MTTPFPGESELIKFMTNHLNELYDAYMEAEMDGDESLTDYVQGSIDTTHVYMIKSGVTPLEYDQYIKLSNGNWKADN